jgi:hypothetical protein
LLEHLCLAGLSLSQCYVVLNLHDLEPRSLEDVFESFDLTDSDHNGSNRSHSNFSSHSFRCWAGVISQTEFRTLLVSLRERSEVAKHLKSLAKGSMVVRRLVELRCCASLVLSRFIPGLHLLHAIVLPGHDLAGEAGTVSTVRLTRSSTRSQFVCRDFSTEGRRARFVLTSFLVAAGLPFRFRQSIM